MRIRREVKRANNQRRRKISNVIQDQNKKGTLKRIF